MEHCKMSDSELDAGIKQDYGRLNFRGVTMAYLVLEDEKRFTLTDVVCNLYPLTPRTTVISRMDKMKIVRTPCTPEQIRKLKAARGVHSSSVVCSLVSKQAIETFCDKYPIDVRISPDTTVVTGKEESGKNINKVNKILGKKTKVVPNPSKDKTVSVKKRRSKKNPTDLSREKRANTVVMNGEDSVHILHTDEPRFHSLSTDSCVGRLTSNNHGEFCKSFVASNHIQNKTKKITRNSFTSKRTSSKLTKPIKNEHLPTKRKKLSDSNEEDALVRKVKKVKLKHSNSVERLVINERSVSTVNNPNSQWWLGNFNEINSHSSPKTNESSFSSFVSSSHENSTTSKSKGLFSSPKKSGSNPAPSKLNKDVFSLNASPPSLILKRQGKRTWQVEQRTVDHPVNKIIKLNSWSDDPNLTSSKKKGNRKGCIGKINSSRINIKKEGISSRSSDQHHTQKTKAKAVKTNSDRNPHILKGGIKRKISNKKVTKRKEQNSGICTSNSLHNGICNNQYAEKESLGLKQNGLLLKKKGRKTKRSIKYQNVSTDNDKITKFGKGKIVQLKKIKTEPLLNDEIDFELSQQKHSNIHQFPTPDSTPSATPTEVKPAKVVVKITPVKSKLKANAKFRFMDIFKLEPSLTIKNGELAPAYSLCPEHHQKPLPSILSTWRMGGGVVGRNNVRYKVRNTKKGDLNIIKK